MEKIILKNSHSRHKHSKVTPVVALAAGVLSLLENIDNTTTPVFYKWLLIWETLFSSISTNKEYQMQFSFHLQNKEGTLLSCL